MKILQTSIVPALSVITLALLSTAQGRPVDATATRQYSGNSNFVLNAGTIGNLSGTNSFGVRFSGTHGATSSGNIVENYGTIVSGTGYSYFGNAGIAFDGSWGGHSNGNIVNNYGTIIGQGSEFGYYPSAGILFNSMENGETNLNVVNNYGSIQANSTGEAMGIGFLVERAVTCANANTIVNNGTITVRSSGGDSTAIGVAFAAWDGVANLNKIINNKLIDVSGDEAMGIGFRGGVTNGNQIVNNASVGVSGSYATGIAFSNYEGASNNNSIFNYGIFNVSAQEGATGIIFENEDGTSNGNVISNYGSLLISGSSDNYGIYFSGHGESSVARSNIINNYGILSVFGPNGWNNGIAFDDGLYSDGNTINNFGTISVSGSNAWNTGIYFDTDGGSANNNIIFNAGQINVVSSGTYSDSTGILFESRGGPVIGNTIVNNGVISASGVYAYGIYFDGEGSPINNNIIVNRGVIQAIGSEDAIAITFDGSYGGANNNVINNWGTIVSSGTAIAIVNGNNNVINLNGHSAVYGLIAASGSNNVLNLNFTGVSAKAAKALRAQLIAQRALGGNESSGSFSFRGVNYTYDPLTVFINTSSYESLGKTPNQKAIGANLDSFKVNPTGDVLALLDTLDASNDPAYILEQLSPQRYQIYGDIALANANFVTQTIDQRLDNVRVGSEMFDTSSLGVSASSIQSKLGFGKRQADLNSATMSKDGKSVTLKDTVPTGNTFGAFLSGELTVADIDGEAWQQDSNFVSSGLLAGIDARITDTLTGGLLFSYAHADADLDSQNSTANVDTYGTGVYGGYQEGNYYANGLFSYARNIYESNRTVRIPGFSDDANGRTSGNQYIFNIDGGYNHPLCEDLTVGPFIGLQYVHLGVNSFTESGAGVTGLDINDQGMDSLRSRLGARLELRKKVTASWTLASEVRAAWQHEFANNDRAIVARFSETGLGSFAVRTNDPERDAALVGLGINATYCESLTTFVDYDVQIDSRYTEQIVKGGFKWSF